MITLGRNKQGWEMPVVSLGDGATSGVSVYRAIGGGFEWAFDSLNDDEISFNIPLKNNGVEYDGSSISVSVGYELGADTGGVNDLEFITEYKFMDVISDPDAGGTLNTDTISIDNEVINTGYEKQLTNLIGVAGSKYLMISIKRKGANPSTDNYSSTVYVTEINFNKI
jgi:hypothetical protein